jgi:hypothetical protein
MKNQEIITFNVALVSVNTPYHTTFNMKKEKKLQVLKLKVLPSILPQLYNLFIVPHN